METRCFYHRRNVVPKMRLIAAIAISRFVLMGDIAKAGGSNILGTLLGASVADRSRRWAYPTFGRLAPSALIGFLTQSLGGAEQLH
jgi:hypothetical protein